MTRRFRHVVRKFVSSKAFFFLISTWFVLALCNKVIQQRFRVHNTKKYPSFEKNNVERPTKLTFRETPHQNDVSSTSMEGIVKQAVIQNRNTLIAETVSKGFTKAVIFGVTAIKNKGDSALSLGAFSIVSAAGMELSYYCFAPCDGDEFNAMAKVIRTYPPTELVLVAQGGGYIGLYESPEEILRRVISHFPNYKVILLGQSIHMPDLTHHERISKVLAKGKDVTIMARDRYSYELAKKNITFVTPLLTPDVAPMMGLVERTVPPMYDVIWLRRMDKESSINSDWSGNISFPEHVTYFISDWRSWAVSVENDEILNAWVQTISGLLFLQRGRVIISDRLHGLILGTLLTQPVVIVDSITFKVSNYKNTWYKGSSKVIVTRHPEEARDKAMMLLRSLSDELPNVPAMARLGYRAFIH